jgi:hypothetical protein
MKLDKNDALFVNFYVRVIVLSRLLIFIGI